MKALGDQSLAELHEQRRIDLYQLERLDAMPAEIEDELSHLAEKLLYLPGGGKRTRPIFSRAAELCAMQVILPMWRSNIASRIEDVEQLLNGNGAKK